jgi:hypothetical protein
VINTPGPVAWRITWTWTGDRIEDTETIPAADVGGDREAALFRAGFLAGDSPSGQSPSLVSIEPVFPPAEPTPGEDHG